MDHLLWDIPPGVLEDYFLVGAPMAHVHDGKKGLHPGLPPLHRSS